MKEKKKAKHAIKKHVILHYSLTLYSLNYLNLSAEFLIGLSLAKKHNKYLPEYMQETFSEEFNS